MSEPQLKAGDDLEHDTAAYFQSFGYFVRRSVKLAVAAGTAEATDIDLLAIRFSTPLSEERLIADCKDSKRSRPFERILWTKGLASFAQADRAVVVAPRAIWQAREFASQGKVEILEASEVAQHVREVGSKGFSPYSASSLLVSKRFWDKFPSLGTYAKEVHQEIIRNRQLLVFGHPLTNFNRLVQSINTLKKKRATTPDESWMIQFGVFDASVIASLLLVRFSAEVKWTPEANWRDYAKKRLTYGDIPPAKAKAIARLTMDKGFYEGLPEPPYTEEIIAAVHTLITQSPKAIWVPQALDLLLFNKLIGQPSIAPAEFMFQTHHDEIFRLARRLLSAIGYAADLPSGYFEGGLSDDQAKT